MKILILANSDGGLYNFRKELVEKLLETCDVSLCLPEGNHTSYFKEIGCKYIPISFERHGTNPFNELELLKKYKKILEQESPDIVFTYTIKPNVYGGMVCAKLEIPYVVNITGLGTAVENAGIMQKITLFLYRKALKKAQKVYFQNTENRDFMIRRGVVSGEYDLLPGSGVNLKKYQVTEYPNRDTIDFMFISRVMKEKGIEQYLDAAKYIRNHYPKTRFHVCGDCEQDYEKKLKELNEQGVIIYHGRVSNIEEMHRISSCTIHPTYYPEGMSNVLLESCACGRPIITTNRSGCREIVDDGVNGFVVRQKDSQDLIEKVEKFLALPWEQRKQMGLAGRVKVEQEFDRKIVIDKYLEEMEKIV
jgi:galacturonosyltransferase